MYGKPAGKTLDIALVVETAKEVHENIIKDAVQKGFPVPEEVLKDYPSLMPVAEKEPWQMTRKEYVLYDTTTQGPGMRGAYVIPRKYVEEFLASRTSDALSEQGIKRITDAETTHAKIVQQALYEGKPVPTNVLKDYPDLMPTPKPTRVERKTQPLPPDAQNVQELSFNSDQFTCYGKQTGRGFRAYCRRK